MVSFGTYQPRSFGYGKLPNQIGGAVNRPAQALIIEPPIQS